MRPSSKALQLWLILSSLALLVISIDPGRLGLTFNGELAGRQKYTWLSMVEYDQNIVDIFSDGDIVGIVRQAHKDMETDHARDDADWKKPEYNIDAKRLARAPAVMTGIVFGKRLYLASSVKGIGLGLAYLPTGGNDKVREALISCQVQSAQDKMHRTWAGCGEPMAAHIAFASGLKSLNGGKVSHTKRQRRAHALR